MSKSNEIVIVGMARTAIGAFQGALASVPASKLGATVIQGALERAKVKPAEVSEVILGNVLMAGQGQAPARQAMIYAGLPHSVPALTIHKVCGSGMKAIMLGAQAILSGDSEIVVAGGMESMSNAPYLLPGARSGYRLGNQQVIDSLVHDGLWDPYNNQHMGNCAELCSREKKISREEQDAFAIESFKRAQAAQSAGKFDSEIVPVKIPSKKGEEVVKIDEGPAKIQFDKVPTLKPVFDKAGSVTAANASTLNDGASAVVLMTAQKAEQMGLKPIAKIISWATHAQAPEWFTIAPIEGMKKAMQKANWAVDKVDLFEVNEAFAVVALAVQKELKIPHEKYNIWGGAISLGHPIGSSGCRIVITLLSALRDKGLKRGVAGICIGGGESTALCLELC